MSTVMTILNISQTVSIVMYFSFVLLSNYYNKNNYEEKIHIFSYKYLFVYYFLYASGVVVNIIKAFTVGLDAVEHHTRTELDVFYAIVADIIFIFIAFSYTYRYPEQLKIFKYKLLNILLLVCFIVSFVLAGIMLIDIYLYGNKVIY